MATRQKKIERRAKKKAKRAARKELIPSIQKPLPSEHACRVASPGQFARFRRDNSKNPNVIIGFKPDGDSSVQAFRYPKARWSASQASAHCRSRGGRFEAAAASKDGDKRKKPMKKEEPSLTPLQTVMIELRPNPGEMRDAFMQRAMERLEDKMPHAPHRAVVADSIYRKSREDSFVDSPTVTPVCGLCGCIEFVPENLRMKCKHEPSRIKHLENFGRLMRQVFGKRDAEKPTIQAQNEPIVLDEEQSDCPIEMRHQILKVEEHPDYTFVWGPVLIPEEIDKQGDIISKEVIEVAAHNFMEDSQRPGLLHRFMLGKRQVIVVESAILPVNLRVGSTRLPAGTWVVGMRVFDKRLRKMITEKKLQGFSIGGHGEGVLEAA